ncbi:histone deacetylase [Hamiltosporidium tvaerminnensis]|uniref:Histone deacetylase n=1 Tax=Hamiltosporidium tvaerminnensis TaxID=1176355 RepID=A0A4Q9LTI7_9MICR|nr:histone deacetylase [Hamiltosporidium tvaerminnensis]
MKIAYMFSKQVGLHHYGQGHPMKPHRITLTHSLVHSYNLDKYLDVIIPTQLTLGSYHNPEYLRDIKRSDEICNVEYDSNKGIVVGLEGDNDRVYDYKGVNNSTNEQQGVNNSTNEQQGVNDSINEQQGVNDSTNNYHPFNNSTNTYHPFSNSTDTNTTNNTPCYGDDCPLFPNLYDFCTHYTSASLLCARLLNSNTYKTTINWSGGFHHARKNEPSGFCYVNDIVIAIQELLKCYERVLYVDIDIHHGDGVEEAFMHCDRVLTFSLHKYGDNYFPGTGGLYSPGSINRGCSRVESKGCYTTDLINNTPLTTSTNTNTPLFTSGVNNTSYITNHTNNTPFSYIVNVPLRTGIDDPSYMYIYEPILKSIIRKYNPSCIVMQCGADSIMGDRLGCFNLSVKGHGECIKMIYNLNLPTIFLGGGGYKMKNVSKCWTYETGLLLGVDMCNDIPKNDRYYEYYGSDYTLHGGLVKKYDNMNSKGYLDSVMGYILKEVDKI